MADEEFEQHRANCINRVKKLISDVDVCIDIFQLDTSIPPDLAYRALNIMFGILGPRSIEMSRYSEYKDKWKSGSRAERRAYLDSLNADLVSGLERLESNSSSRWVVIGFGSVEYERYQPIDMAKALGLPDNQTSFIKRLRRLCGRLEIALQFDCPDAAAYYLRKILEMSII
ncbi:MAG: hypothetical protein E4H14_11255 [Candidatus Thorarchaeota archaeon]|nr:MAG: hypothetical protein E4H14_11255 [Candidatus Thorarchaeota archaeon]